MNRVAIFHGQPDGDVTRFMNRSRVAFLFIHHKALTFRAHQDLVARIFDMRATDGFGIIARRGNRSFVKEVS